jgi:hypothetical protein
MEKKHRLLWIGLLLLAGCSSASPEYAAADRIEVGVGNRTFHVYSTGRTAQAIRMNREWGADQDSIDADATVAIARATGCGVDEKSLRGDHTIITAKIAC